MIINPYLVQPSTPAFTGLLDTYGGASVAYSLRKLSSTYLGNCIRVRRSSDNTEQDFGFITNVLDTASLLTFCGAGNGFVTTWYDQSGNGINTTQGTASAQPQIVSSGNIQTQNSKNVIKFDGSNDSLFTTSLTPAINNCSLFMVQRVITQSGEDLPFGFGVTADTYKIRSIYSASSGKLGFATWGLDFSGTITTVDSNLNMISVTQNGTTINTKKNTTTSNGNLPSTPSQTGTGNFSIGTLQGGAALSYITDMVGCEYIFYPSDQSSNRTGIENNINSFYTLW